MGNEIAAAESEQVFYDDDKCFVCGRQNPDGLQLGFDLDLTNNSVSTRVTPGTKYQGWSGKLHGGIVTSILDEVMVNAAYILGFQAVTGEIRVRFRSAVMADDNLKFTGRITEIRKKFLKAEADCIDSDNKIVAESSSTLIRVY